ncbi:hypothetical protein GETHLI_19150 [Geothrix limicola]|uniref:Lipoprotein n=1 Tax=Geothrix limicola TaxID=2927978 RepID=A0ABQ5QFS0_9BACT|nr:hypothetical protein [Geothrix limicola]GLH73413.1 hypothetical protein GETHLI_19150 [Geothrix limicola]
MNRNLVVPLFSLVLLSGCMVAPRMGGGLEIVPILPVVVEVDADSYYAHGGYHYFYNDDRWYYSETRDGRRMELPRSHWPRETRRPGWDRH